MGDESIGRTMPMMKMYFHGGLGDELLFKGLVLDSDQKLWLACALLFASSLMFEAIKILRTLKCRCELRSFKPKTDNHSHRANSLRNEQSDRLCCSGIATAEVRGHCEFGLFGHRRRTFRFIQATLYSIQTTLAFVLMLAVMTYNVCLISAIVLGKDMDPQQRYVCSPSETRPFQLIATPLHSHNRRRCWLPLVSRVRN